jgi:hypothetical protein
VLWKGRLAIGLGTAASMAIVTSCLLPVITQTVFSGTHSWSPGDFFGGEFFGSFCQKYFEKRIISYCCKFSVFLK